MSLDQPSQLRFNSSPLCTQAIFSIKSAYLFIRWWNGTQRLNFSSYCRAPISKKKQLVQYGLPEPRLLLYWEKKRKQKHEKKTVEQNRGMVQITQSKRAAKNQESFGMGEGLVWLRSEFKDSDAREKAKSWRCSNFQKLFIMKKVSTSSDILPFYYFGYFTITLMGRQTC